MTPVYTAVGQGTLWVGSMFLARNPRAMKAKRIRVRMSCLGQDVPSLTRMKGELGIVVAGSPVTLIQIQELLAAKELCAHRVWQREVFTSLKDP